jgi:hypothetical protein
MIRLLIGLRIIQGPRGSRPVRASTGTIKRRVLCGVCCVLIASAATHSGAGRVTSTAQSPPNIVRHVQTLRAQSRTKSRDFGR